MTVTRHGNIVLEGTIRTRHGYEFGSSGQSGINFTLTTGNGDNGQSSGSILISTADTHRIYNPFNDTLATPSGNFTTTANIKFNSGFLMFDGRVFLTLATNTASLNTNLIYDPVTDTYSTQPGTYSGTLLFSVSVPLHNGNIFLVVRSHNQWIVYDLVNDKNQIVGTDATSNKTWGATILPWQGNLHA